ncbi:MAG: hypothetical protein KDC35_12340 [Acidobacteria bacterium]|nr:hypothetical protein [Acidobacteriota bacterium]
MVESMDSWDVRLARIEQRLARIERRLDMATDVQVPPTQASIAADTVTITTETGMRFTSLLGRTSLVLAGAFLLRFITQSGSVVPVVGLSLGAVYALSWLWLANRSGQERLSATFHGATSALLSIPLIIEALFTFHILTPVLAACAITATTTAYLTVAYRRALRTVAWLTVIGTMAALMVMAFRTHQIALFVLPLSLLALGTTWMGYSKSWRWLRWPCALSLDFLMLVGYRLPKSESSGLFEPFSIPIAQAIALAIPALFLILFRIIQASGRPTRLFAYIQGIAICAIGITGASVLTPIGISSTWVALMALLISAFSFHWSFSVPEDPQAGRLAGILGLMTLLFSALSAQNVAAWGLVICSLLLLALARSYQRADLHLHIAVSLTAAAFFANLIVWTAKILSQGPMGPSPEWMAFLPAMAAGVCYGVFIANPPDVMHWTERAARSLTLLLLVSGICVALVFGLFQVIASLMTASVAHGHLVVITVGAAASIALVLLGRRDTLRECVWLSPLVLLVLGAKLILIDLRSGTELTLFCEFALLGLALMVTAKLRKKTVPPGQPLEGT